MSCTALSYLTAYISGLMHPRLLVLVRHSASDSDSDYGSHSKKKKKPKVSADEIRVSSRGGKVPNYIDDVQDFDQFDEDDIMASTYADAAVPLKEEDEIESVLGHCRDEGHEADADDNWYSNIVRSPHPSISASAHPLLPAFPHQVEELLSSTQHRRSL